MSVNFNDLVSKQFDPNKLQVFLHMPKTAGNSMSDALTAIYGDSYRKTSPKEMLEILKQPRGMENFKAVLGHYRLCDPFYMHLQPEINHYVIVRDPIERVISQYYFLRSREDHALHEKALQYSLDEIFRSDDLIYEMGMSDFQTQVLSSFLRAGNPKLMVAYAKARLVDAFTFFGLFEKLPEFVKICAHQLGWNISELPVVNVSEHPSKEEIPKSLRLLIEERNQLDRRLYRHAQEIYEDRIKYYNHILIPEVEIEVQPIIVSDRGLEEVVTTRIETEEVPTKKKRFSRIRQWFRKIFRWSKSDDVEVGEENLPSEEEVKSGHE